tara:strand:- start:674 stop:877 length:204 start_codon:yes stop_codon:yes gene_type:complete
LHADFFVEHAGFSFRETCHSGAVEGVVIMIVPKKTIYTKRANKEASLTMYESEALLGKSCQRFLEVE